MATLDDLEYIATHFASLTKKVNELTAIVENLQRNNQQLLTQKEAAKQLGITEPTIISYRKKGIITPIFTGKKFRYPITEINRIKQL